MALTSHTEETSKGIDCKLSVVKGILSSFLDILAVAHFTERFTQEDLKSALRWADYTEKMANMAQAVPSFVALLDTTLINIQNTQPQVRLQQPITVLDLARARRMLLEALLCNPYLQAVIFSETCRLYTLLNEEGQSKGNTTQDEIGLKGLALNHPLIEDLACAARQAGLCNHLETLDNLLPRNSTINGSKTPLYHKAVGCMLYQAISHNGMPHQDFLVKLEHLLLERPSIVTIVLATLVPTTFFSTSGQDVLPELKPKCSDTSHVLVTSLDSLDEKLVDWLANLMTKHPILARACFEGQDARLLAYVCDLHFPICYLYIDHLAMATKTWIQMNGWEHRGVLDPRASTNIEAMVQLIFSSQYQTLLLSCCWLQLARQSDQICSVCKVILYDIIQSENHL